MTAGEDRRQFERIAAKIAVRFTRADEAARALRAYSLNFSVGGLCLKTKRTYALGDRLNLSMSVGGHAFQLQGVVAWVRVGVAIGVRFIDVGDPDRARLEALAKSLKK